MPVFLTLGPMTFADFEIPEEINFGGEQSLSTKKLIGGKRQIDVMGRDDMDIGWSGLFRGVTASERVSFLDGLRVKGAPLPLFWSQFNYLVLIKSFRPVFRRFYWYDYEIICTVIQDLNKPFPILLPVAYNDAINNQLTEANDISFLINNPSILSAMALLSESINSVASIENAGAATIATITGPLNSAIDTTGQQISSLSASTFA